ncbi:MAG: carboxymuconolactone decarboxylase family protein, partial [Fidelibacterota bacterium]
PYRRNSVGAIMAYIEYVPFDQIPESDRVDDEDNIIRISGVQSRVMKAHYDLYREIIIQLGSLSRVQKEMIAVVVSSLNGCHY